MPTVWTRASSSTRRLAAIGALSAVMMGLAVAPAHASTSPLCTTTPTVNPFNSTTTTSGAYAIADDEWNSAAAECLTTDGSADFAISQSAIDPADITDPANGPGAYPDIGTVSINSDGSSNSDGLPIPVSDLGDATTSWSTAQPGTGTYDVAYDIWYSPSATTCDPASGQDTELMIWLTALGKTPVGTLSPTRATVDDATFDVYQDTNSSHALVSYELASSSNTGVSTLAVGNLDLRDFTADAVVRGVVPAGSYLCSVQAGFELWNGGTGLTTKSFSFTAATGLPTGKVASGVPGKCLDDANADTAPGSPVDVFTCMNSLAQSWTLGNDGTVKVSGMCLSPTGAGTAAGTPLELNTCGGQAGQAWQPGSEHSLVNTASGMCLSDPGSAVGVQLQLAACTGAQAQQWRPPYNGVAVSGPLTSAAASGECLDDWHGGTTAGNPVDIYTCNSSQAQDWTLSDGNTVEDFGLCLDTVGGGTAAGTAVELNTCSGAADQTWVVQPDGYLFNPDSGDCLDVPATASGTQLQIAACNAASAQIWYLPA